MQTPVTMPGCSYCAHAKHVLEKVKLDYPELEVVIHKVTEEPELAGQYMLLSAPGVVIDDELVFTGGVDEAKLREHLNSAKT